MSTIAMWLYLCGLFTSATIYRNAPPEIQPHAAVKVVVLVLWPVVASIMAIRIGYLKLVGR